LYNVIYTLADVMSKISMSLSSVISIYTVIDSGSFY